MMTRDELAQRLSREMQKVRLERIGEPLPPERPVEELGESEVQNWRDMAGVVISLAEGGELSEFGELP